MVVMILSGKESFAQFQLTKIIGSLEHKYSKEIKLIIGCVIMVIN